MARADSPSVLVARTEARARRRSLIGLGLLAGITVGLAVASVSGAIRTDTALERLRARENAADAVVFPSQVGAFEPDWDALAERPEVAKIARWALLFGTVGEGAPESIPPGPNLVFGSVDGTFYGDMGRPVVVEGRMYDPEADDEVIVDEGVPELEVGDVIPFTLYGPEEFSTTGESTGPSIDLRVVGRVRTLNQFIFTGQVVASPGLLAQHGDEILRLENGDVQLRNGPADMDAFERSVNEVLAPGAPVLDLHEASRRVTTSTGVEHPALLILAGIILLAGAALVGQAVTHSALASVEELQSLRALGMTRSEVVQTVTRAHVTASVSAVAAAVAVTVVASRWFPIGTAARVDPDRGFQVLWRLTLPAALALGALLLALVALSSRRGGRVRRTGSSTTRFLEWLRGTAPVPVGLGVTMALSPGHGATRVPVRQALVGAAVGVLGVVATVTLSAGLADALDHPERAGVAWDASGIALPEDLTPRSVAPELTTAVAETQGVDDVAVVDRQVIAVDGVGTPVYALSAPAGETTDIQLVVTEGRAPETDEEIAIGPATAERSDVGIGDTVQLDGGGSFDVVGLALFPSDVHATFDDGAWVTTGTYRAMVPPAEDSEEGPTERSLAIRFGDGVSLEDGTEALQASVGDHFDEIGPVEVPAELTNLDNVRRLPDLLAAFLVLLGVGALGHVLATSARRRRHDFAVLRAMGLRRSAARGVLNVQGTVVGIVGLLVGVPLGIVLGRAGWGLIAESVPIEVVRPVAVLTLLALIPVALVLANALAVWPGHRVARLHPAEVLRAE